VLNRFVHFRSDTDPSHTPLTTQNCHIQESCAGGENTPLAQLNPSCPRGQIGEAWLGTETARQRVQAASVALTAARKISDGWNEHCTSKAADIQQQKPSSSTTSTTR
jgi:hypothetical protein